MTHSAAPRAYLVGLSTFQAQPLLGEYEQGSLCLNACGLIVADEWVRSAANRKGIAIDAWRITPNQLQSIVFLHMPITLTSGLAGGLTESLGSQKPWLLSSFIASFKAAAAKRINLRLNQVGQLVWQRSYSEHLISDAARLSQLRHQLQAVEP
ncbi:hypothetical protein IQ265_16810 [Nodosilinea sp. LEGE 06152]|uniref:transposase n=1 Tax=Nodosilinea sp. LEGE 06152 TaxID=2777966 RepID=UPI00188107E8|nr:transposase [Nodosilinea sp. LEGE 06152]MBE9158480.1 hypothetical protein [Nodosilinea sp. LEGE 06152]